MISYIIRLIFQNQDETKNWMLELQANDEVLPTIGSNLAFKIFNRYMMFEVSMIVFYPGSDMQPVIVTKASKIPEEDFLMEIVDSIKQSCNNERMTFRQFKDLVSKVS